MTPRDWPTFWQSLTPAEVAAALRAAPRVAGPWRNAECSGECVGRCTCQFMALRDRITPEGLGVQDAPAIERMGGGYAFWDLLTDDWSQTFESIDDAKKACDENARAAGWVLL